MIIIPAHTLWTLLGIWLAVAVCAFMSGWYVRAYSRAEQEAVERAVRRHPSSRFRADHLPRPGLLLADPPKRMVGRKAVINPDPGRWWPALERTAPPDTTPFSHVELSNWEKRIRRDTDAWLRERGML